MEFTEKYKKYRDYFGKSLDAQLDVLQKSTNSSELFSAIKYSLKNGGKRLRPVLFLATYDFLTGEKLFTEQSFAGGAHGWNCESLCTLKNTNQASFDVDGKKSLESCVAVSDVSDNNCDNKDWGRVVGDISCAIEMLHTYTLIHDDLPCLDNDDFRRGKQSCHKKFGEAIALLAGDALLNHTFTLLLGVVAQNTELAGAVHKFSILTGLLGVIGGQSKELEVMKNIELRLQRTEIGAADQSICFKTQDCVNDTDRLAKLNLSAAIESENVFASDKHLVCDVGAVSEKSLMDVLKKDFLSIYKNKTAALFSGALTLAAGAAYRTDCVQALESFAENFGLAFQLKDDLSDNNKESFAYFFGMDATQAAVDYYSENARKSAKALGSDFLLKMVDFDKLLTD